MAIYRQDLMAFNEFWTGVSRPLMRGKGLFKKLPNHTLTNLAKVKALSKAPMEHLCSKKYITSIQPLMKHGPWHLSYVTDSISHSFDKIAILYMWNGRPIDLWVKCWCLQSHSLSLLNHSCGPNTSVRYFNAGVGELSFTSNAFARALAFI